MFPFYCTNVLHLCFCCYSLAQDSIFTFLNLRFLLILSLNRTEVFLSSFHQQADSVLDVSNVAFSKDVQYTEDSFLSGGIPLMTVLFYMFLLINWSFCVMLKMDSRYRIIRRRFRRWAVHCPKFGYISEQTQTLIFTSCLSHSWRLLQNLRRSLPKNALALTVLFCYQHHFVRLCLQWSWILGQG